MNPTRFKELGYVKVAPGLWRIVSREDGAAIGPHYPSKAELMADLERYAIEYGVSSTVGVGQAKLRLDTFAANVLLISTSPAPSKFGLWVGGDGPDCIANVEIEPGGTEDPVWDHVIINGQRCGNRCGGVGVYTAMCRDEIETKYPLERLTNRDAKLASAPGGAVLKLQARVEINARST